MSLVTLKQTRPSSIPTLSEDRVKHARSYMKSIFAEAVEQDFLLKDPTRGIKIPRNLREKDKTTLTWHQLRAVLTGVATWPIGCSNNRSKK